MKKFLPWIITFLIVAWIIAKMIPVKEPPGFDTGGFGRLPILVNGRVMPMDTLARLSLLAMNHHGTCTTFDGKNVPQVRWLLDLFMIPEHADAAKVFEVTNPEVLGLFGWQETTGKATNYSFNDFKPFFTEIEKQAGLAAQTESATRNAFQRGVIKLHDALGLYVQLLNTVQADDSPDFGKELQMFDLAIRPGMQAIREREANRSFNKQDLERILLFTRRYQDLGEIRYAYAIPNRNGATDADRWEHISQALLSAIPAGEIPYPATVYGRLISAYREGNADEFNKVIGEYNQYLEGAIPQEVHRTRLEFLFSQAQPFLQAAILYLIVLLFALVSWLKWPKTLGKTALILLLLAFLIHTAGLVTRMYLQGRPPVTNLYSSAIFVGWGSVLLCLFLERFYQNAIGSVCASAIGFVTLLIAQNLQLDGDTLEMLRAVLDTNVWLATHVVMVTLGYSATFLAGFLGIIYILRGLFTRSFDEITAKSLGRMMYGVVCFATLFSFVGTILGGIWADQSWGRFWGWDPKENGALLIVIWNAIILHARWGGYARERGLAAMTVFGNVITSLSWFGVNMLGVGLHSYGFMEQAFAALLIFIVSQLAIVALGMLPQKYWRGVAVTDSSSISMLSVAPVTRSDRLDAGRAGATLPD
jgi:ABC-type transport system involved in cytochrome c biogenesis permease subunit